MNERAPNLISALCVLLSATCICFADHPPKSSTNPQSATRSSQSFKIDPFDLSRPAIRVFTDKDGLPMNTVEAIALDHKGYIWIGTQNGAAYYNGRKWTLVDMPNKAISNYVFDLIASSDGGIWFATKGGISRLKDEQWTTFDKSSGLPDNMVYDLLETTSSTGRQVVWAATDGGAARLEEGRWTVYDTGSGLPDNQALCLLETVSSNGSRIIWVGTNRGLARLEDGKRAVYDAKSGLPDNRVQSMTEGVAEDSSRVLWVGTNKGIAKLEKDKWTIYDAKSGMPNYPLYQQSLLESVSADGKRALWVGTQGGGLARLEQDRWTVYDTKSGLSSNVITCLFETVQPDGKRALWVGTYGGGLVRLLEQGKWTSFDTTSGLPGNGVSSILESVSPNGERVYWIGTYNGLARLENGRWTVYDTKSGLSSNVISCLFETVQPDGKRALWVGTQGGGLARLENGRWTVYDEKSGLPNNFVYFLFETETESGERVIGAGTYGGLAKFENGKWTVYNAASDLPIYDAASGLPNNDVHILPDTVSKDGSRALWRSKAGVGLAKLENGKWMAYDAASGLPNNLIKEIYKLHETVSPDGSRLLWVGTDGGGIARKNLDSRSGKWSVLTKSTTPALPDDAVWEILEDSRRRIYLFTNKGVARLTPQSNGNPYQNISDYDVYTFTTEDGLPNNEFQTGKYLVDSLGRIWAGTIAGVAMFDPSKEYEDRIQKPLCVERVLLGGKPREIKNASLAYSENNLTFEFALLSYFRESDTRYRSQLVGFDEQSSDWTANPERIYTNLPEGEFVFNVWGRDYAGNISGPQELAFKIKAAPWRTWWAYFLYFTALIGIGYTSQRWRLRSLEQRNLLLEAKIAERTGELSEALEQVKVSQQETEKKNEELGSKNTELSRQKEEMASKNAALVESHKRADRIFSALSEALPGTVLDEKYRIDEKIGAGGFGAVYRAMHLSMKRPVAVKIFKPMPGNDSADALARFEQEAVSACRINHPNAVAVLDSGISAEGIAYLVMELLEGRSLKEELDQKRCLSPARAAEILAPVCDLLSKVHSIGIVHRDVKPENIFLHRDSNGETVKVVDFGIAKLMGKQWGTAAQSLTGTGALIGTPTYMAPERLANEPYDGKADVYSLGVMLYEMLCGRVPFHSGAGPWQTALMHLTVEPPPLRQYNPHISEAAEAAVMRVLEKDPEKRPDAAQLKSEFLTAIGIDPDLHSSEELNALLLERLTEERLAEEGETFKFEPEASSSVEERDERPESWRRLDALMDDALERETSERDAFLNEACAGDEELRKAAERLLTAYRKAENFLASPVLDDVIAQKKDEE